MLIVICLLYIGVVIFFLRLDLVFLFCCEEMFMEGEGGREEGRERERMEVMWRERLCCC